MIRIFNAKYETIMEITGRLLEITGDYWGLLGITRDY